MKKILIIEDHPDVRENIAEILELANYHVFKAENGKSGIEQAQGNKPDLIICDIMMPALDGYGVLHILHQSPELMHIPVIFLTAKSERTDFRKGMELGADDYLTKPFDDIELLRAVEARLKRSENLHATYSRTLQGVQSFFNDASKWVKLETRFTEKRQKHVLKKDFIYRAGSAPLYVYFLLSGKAKETQAHEYGKCFITTLYKPGDFFGYTALLNATDYDESVEALEDCEVVQISKTDFFTLLNQNVEIMHQFIKLLANDVKEKEEQLVNQAYSSVRKRTAKALVHLYKQYQNNSKDTFSMHMSREDLANMVGTATESLIRTLSDFKAEGLVALKGSHIQILKPDALQHIKG